MDIDEVIADLMTFPSLPRCFTFQELLDFTELEVDQEELRRSVLGDARFIHLHSRLPREDRFILDSTLFQWFSSLNIRLAKAGLFKLTERQLARAMSLLINYNEWEYPPVDAIHWGRSLGLVGTSFTPTQYIFPLARVLASLDPFAIDVVADVFEDCCERQVWKQSMINLLNECVQQGLSEIEENVDQRTIRIVKARDDFFDSEKMTLAQLGASMGLTRERIRQLERKFWSGARRWRKPWGRAFLVAFVYDFLAEAGSVVLESSNPRSRIRKFLASCAGIHYSELWEGGPSVLSTSVKDLDCLVRCESYVKSLQFPSCLDVDIVVNGLEPKFAVFDSDLKGIANSMVHFRRKRLRRPQMVHVALQSIGRPAHYSEVTSIHNELFPDRPSIEPTVHNILSNGEYGIVWVGIRGTYALKDWGYEHPSETLFDAVRSIVERAHKATHKPVPFDVILAEMGRYRRIVNQGSLRMTADLHPKLKRTSGGAYLPIIADQKPRDEPLEEEWGTALESFWKGRQSQG